MPDAKCVVNIWCKPGLTLYLCFIKFRTGGEAEVHDAACLPGHRNTSRGAAVATRRCGAARQTELHPQEEVTGRVYRSAHHSHCQTRLYTEAEDISGGR